MRLKTTPVATPEFGIDEMLPASVIAVIYSTKTGALVSIVYTMTQHCSAERDASNDAPARSSINKPLIVDAMTSQQVRRSPVPAAFVCALHGFRISCGPLSTRRHYTWYRQETRKLRTQNFILFRTIKTQKPQFRTDFQSHVIKAKCIKWTLCRFLLRGAM